MDRQRSGADFRFRGHSPDWWFSGRANLPMRRPVRRNRGLCLTPRRDWRIYVGVKDWGKKGRIWGELVSIREVHLLPLGPRGPQMTATVFDTTGSRIVKSWDLPAAQVRLLVAAATQMPPVLRVSGTVGTAGASDGELRLCGVMPADLYATESIDS